MRSTERSDPDTPPTRPASHRKDSLWSLLGSGSQAACGWLLLVVLARTEGARSAGIYSLALAICTPVFLFSNGGLRQRLAAGHPIPSPQSLMKLRGALWAFSSLVVGLASLRLYAGSWLLLGSVILWKIDDSLADLRYGHLQRRREFRRLGLHQAARTWAAAMAGCALLLSGSGPTVAVAVAALVGIALTLTLRVHWREPSRRITAELIWAVSFLGGVSLLIALLPNLPRVMIAQHHPEVAVASFAFLYIATQLGGLPAGAVAQAALPRLGAAVSQRAGRPFMRLITRTVVATSALGLVTTMSAAVVVTKFTAPLAGVPALEIRRALAFGLLTSLVFPLNALNVALVAIGANRAQLLTLVAAGLIALCIGIAVIPSSALNGGASMVGGGAGVAICLQIAVIRRTVASWRPASSEGW